MARKSKFLDERIPAKLRHDGWQNVFTGLGTTTKDKRTGGKVSFDGVLQEREVEEIYAADGQARRLADILPQTATRQWIEFDKNVGDIKKIESEVDRLKIKAVVKECWSMARIYGGGGAFINVGDPIEQLKKPLDKKNIQQFVSLIPLTRWELQVRSTDITSDLTSPNFGKPEIYHLVTKRAGSAMINYVPIHYTRIVRFDGLYLPRNLAYQNQLWGSDVYTPVWEALRDYGISFGSVASILQDFRILVYKIAGLSQIVDSEDIDKLKVRLEAMNLSKSVLGAFLLDTEEDMEYFSSPVAGVADLLNKMKERLASCTDIPHTILFNESPSGLGATGRTEEKQWFDYVKSEQETYLAPNIDQIFEIMFLAKSGPTGGRIPEDWTYEFNSLVQMTAEEEASIKKTKAETSKINVETGLIDADEARQMDFPDLEGSAPVPEEPAPVQVIAPGQEQGVIPKALKANAGGASDKTAAAGKK
jgi:phage-related protein (TIGR01555 family)